jgi:hypothetical protein
MEFEKKKGGVNTYLRDDISLQLIFEQWRRWQIQRKHQKRCVCGLCQNRKKNVHNSSSAGRDLELIIVEIMGGLTRFGLDRDFPTPVFLENRIRFVGGILQNDLAGFDVQLPLEQIINNAFVSQGRKRNYFSALCTYHSCKKKKNKEKKI